MFMFFTVCNKCNVYAVYMFVVTPVCGVHIQCRTQMHHSQGPQSRNPHRGFFLSNTNFFQMGGESKYKSFIERSLKFIFSLFSLFLPFAFSLLFYILSVLSTSFQA